MPDTAYAFNGQSGIQVPETIFGPTAPAVTISMWVTTYNENYSFVTLLEKGPLNGEMNMGTTSSGQFQFGPILSTYGTEFVSAPLMSNAIIHLVGVYQKGQSIALYTNGVLATNMAIPDDTLRQTSQYPIDSALGIYDYTPGPFGGFPGNIEDVRIYTNALTASQVQQLYQYEATTPFQPPIITSFAPVSAFVGTNVTITGLDFSPVTSSNIVYFGAVQADVIEASPTNLVVTVPVGATFAPITVTVNGLTGYSDQPFLPTFLGSGQINSSSLGLPMVLSTGAGPSQTVFADIDGDGRPDLIVADAYSADVSIYQNISSNGILSFAPPVVLPIVPAAYGNAVPIAVADIDGDGKLDIVAMTSNSNLIYVFRNISSPGLLTTNSFAAPVTIPAGVNSQSIAVQDLNGDGKPDVVIPNTSSSTISIFQNTSTIGNISFAAPVSLFAGNNPSDAGIADLDGDGYPDLVVPNMSDGTVSVFRNLGVGGNITTNSFAPRMVFSGVPQSRFVKIGDMDGDGKLDIVVADWLTDTFSVLRNLTAGPGITNNSFAAPVSFSTGGWANNLTLGDLSGDGKLDVAVPEQLPSLFSIFHNISAPGSFTANSLAARVDFTSGWNPDGVTIGDLNGDGRPDVVVANSNDNTVYVFQNNTPPPLPVITNEPQDDYVNAYGLASFTVGVTGSSPLSYQWLFDGSVVGNATNDTLIVPNTDPSDLGQYFVLITNMYGAATSYVANLYMYPAIVDPFRGIVTESGQTNTLSVGAWGSGVLMYQWYDNGASILNATNATLTFPDIQFSDAGSYSVVVTSSLGSVTNSPAQVVVNPPGFSIGLYPGIMVTGTVGNSYVIQSSPDLSNSNDWTTLGTITLTAPVQLWVDTNIDASLPANPRHFYRLVPGP
jgi:hypothetical protein